MNNEKQLPEAPASAAEKLPVYKKRKILILLSALLAALILLNAAMIVLLAIRASDGESGDADGGAVSTEDFVYNKGDITKYLPGFSASTVSGIVAPGKEYKLDEITDETILEYINQQILKKVSASDDGKTNKTRPIDYGDVVYLYILYVEKDGEKIGIDYFNSAYSSLSGYQIGSNQFGKEFDAALMGKIPAEMGSTEFDAIGTISDGDVICITYTATVDGAEEAAEKAKSERLELATADAAFKAALLASCKAIGQEFKFDLTTDIDKDGDEELVHYVATVDSVARESNITKLTATLPEDFFGKSMDEKYTSLNGASLDFYVSVSHSVAYENSYEVEVEVTEEIEKEIEKEIEGEDGEKITVTETVTETVTKKVKEKRYIEHFDDLTYTFIKETLQHTFSTVPKGDTEDALNEAARKQYFEDIKKTQTESYNDNVKNNTVSVIWSYLMETVEFDALPEQYVADSVVAALDEFEYQYNYQLASDPNFSVAFANIEEYAVYYYGPYGYDPEEYETYSDFVKEYLIPGSVKQMLLTYAIVDELGLKETKYNTVYDRYLQELIDDAKVQGESLTREDAIKYYVENYGATYLDSMVYAELANDYIYENNRVDWELSSEKAE